MQTVGLTLMVVAILAALGFWGYRQWQRGHLAHVSWLPKPPPPKGTP